MTREEIEEKRKELTDILAEEDAGQRLEKLQQLAKEVGASVTRMEKIEIRRDRVGAVQYQTSNEITEAEIVYNIQIALQTEAMIEMSRISSRNFWIAVVASIVAFFSMLAAWVAALVK